MVRFVTNTTKESKQDLLERLKKLEFDISEDEIFTSLTAARNLVEQKQVRPMLLVDDRALPDFTGETGSGGVTTSSSCLIACGRGISLDVPVITEKSTKQKQQKQPCPYQYSDLPAKAWPASSITHIRSCYRLGNKRSASAFGIWLFQVTCCVNRVWVWVDVSQIFLTTIHSKRDSLCSDTCVWVCFYVLNHTLTLWEMLYYLFVFFDF